MNRFIHYSSAQVTLRFTESDSGGSDDHAVRHVRTRELRLAADMQIFARAFCSMLVRRRPVLGTQAARGTESCLPRTPVGHADMTAASADLG